MGGEVGIRHDYEVTSYDFGRDTWLGVPVDFSGNGKGLADFFCEI